MKNLHTITKFAILFCVVVLLMTIMDFLALHDIRQDYLSKEIIDYLDLTISGEIPDWTETTGEWQLVGISFVSRFFFFIFIIILLLNYMKKVKYIKNST